MWVFSPVLLALAGAGALETSEWHQDRKFVNVDEARGGVRTSGVGRSGLGNLVPENYL